MSNIYKRKDGRWEGRYKLEDGNLKYVYGKTYEEVKNKIPNWSESDSQVEFLEAKIGSKSFLSYKVLKPLLEYCLLENIYPEIPIACFTGASISEIPKIKWIDVNFKTNLISISNRVLPLNKFLGNFLKIYYESNYFKQECFICPYSVRTCQTHLLKATSQIDFKYNATFSTIRNSFINKCIRENMSLFLLSDILGVSLKDLEPYRELCPEYPDSKKTAKIFNALM